MYEIDLYKEYSEYVQGYAQVNVHITNMEGSWEEGTESREHNYEGLIKSNEKFTIEVTGVDNNSQVIINVDKNIFSKEFEEGTGAIMVETIWEGEYGTHYFNNLLDITSGDHIIDVDAEVLNSEGERSSTGKNYEVKEVRVNSKIVRDEYLVDGKVEVSVPNKQAILLSIELIEVI